jgi:23S rRNA pseudouridine2457 synthase
MQHRYFVLNKPQNMVSQFISSHNVSLLGNISFKFPEGTHAVGRLDKDSEGLLLLTTDKKVTRLLFLAPNPHERKYLVMVQNQVTPETFEKLKNGVHIKITEGQQYFAVPSSIEIIDQPQTIVAQAADIREKFPHTWLLITLTEGKFRQVRKMVLAVKHRCLRLIRVSITDMKLGNLPVGQVKEFSRAKFYELLRLPQQL